MRRSAALMSVDDLASGIARPIFLRLGMRANMLEPGIWDYFRSVEINARQQYMTRFDVLSRIILATLPAAFSIDTLLPDPVNAGERIEPPASAMVAQLQPGTSADRITSWYGYELKLIGPNRLGIFLEGGGLVGAKSCRCSGGDGSCRVVVAETPHYSFCARQRGNPCTGVCIFE